MKPTLRDYLTIAAALLAILLCGYGIGFLVGERTTQKRLASGSADAAGHRRDWENATLERLSDELDLTPEQQLQAGGEIHESAEKIARIRDRAIDAYRKELLDLHERIGPCLSEKQRRRMEESRQLLKKSLDKTEEGSEDTRSN